MKIAHLISSNGLFGAEKVMLSLASRMNDGNFSSWVMLIRNSHNPHLETKAEAERLGINTMVFECRGRFNLNVVFKINDFLKRKNIDILHTHNYKSNFLGLLAARKAKIPIITTVHGYINNGIKLKLYECIDRFMLRYFDKVIFVDDTLKIRFKNNLHKSAVINNAALLSGESDNIGKPNNHRNNLVIGSVSRLSKEKGHRYLIEAFSKVNQEFPDTRLLIIGDGELRRNLENLSSALGIRKKVTFAGFREDVSRYYSLIDIFVSSSLSEQLSLSILEAMSYKKAIIATAVGGTPKLIKDGYTGILIMPRSSDEIYRAISNLMSDNSLIKRLGENARRFVKENYPLENMVNGYQRIYAEVI